MGYYDENGAYIPDETDFQAMGGGLGVGTPDINYAGGSPYFNEQTGTYSFPNYQDPSYGIYFNDINLDDPSVWAQYGLTPEDFVQGGVPVGPGMDQGGTQYGGEDYSQMPSNVDNQTLKTLYDMGVRDFSGLDLTDEQISALRDEGLTDQQMASSGAGGESFWSKLGNMGLGALGKIGQAGLDNPLAAIAALAGGGAALGAAVQPGVKPQSAPNFSASTPMSPEQQQLYAYLQAQAAREEGLQQKGVYGDILDTVKGQIPGLRGQSTQEQAARNQALSNISGTLQNPQDPNALPEAYRQYMLNADEAERQLGDVLGQQGGPSAEAQRKAGERRLAYEDQQRNALGTGYLTSTPYQQGKWGPEGVEQAVQEYLDSDAAQGTANRLAMLSGVSMPRAQFAEQAKSGQAARTNAQQQQYLQNYAGLNQTADALGKLTATTNAATPTGTAAQGLGAVSGIQDRQQQLLNSIYQFNSNLQNQKNQSLWQFAGTALGGGLYGLSKTAKA